MTSARRQVPEAASTLSGVTLEADRFLGVIDEVLAGDDRLTVEREIFGELVQRMPAAKERRVDFGPPPSPAR